MYYAPNIWRNYYFAPKRSLKCDESDGCLFRRLFFNPKLLRFSHFWTTPRASPQNPRSKPPSTHRTSSFTSFSFQKSTFPPLLCFNCIILFCAFWQRARFYRIKSLGTRHVFRTALSVFQYAPNFAQAYTYVRFLHTLTCFIFIIGVCVFYDIRTKKCFT